MSTDLLRCWAHTIKVKNLPLITALLAGRWRCHDPSNPPHVLPTPSQFKFVKCAVVLHHTNCFHATLKIEKKEKKGNLISCQATKIKKGKVASWKNTKKCSYFLSWRSTRLNFAKINICFCKTWTFGFWKGHPLI
jgi:hypothetical protein